MKIPEFTKSGMNVIIGVFFICLSAICFFKVGIFSPSDLVQTCNDCSKVKTSIYSKFIGVPTEFVGGIAYMFIGLLSFFVVLIQRWVIIYNFFVAMRETIFAIAIGVHSFLIYAMAYKLGTICSFCLIMFFSLLVGAGFSFFTIHTKKRLEKSFGHLFAMLLCALMTSESYAGIERNNGVISSSPTLEISDNVEKPLKSMTLHVYTDLSCAGCRTLRNEFLPKLKEKCPYLDIIEKEVSILDNAGGKKAVIFVQIARMLGRESEVKDVLFAKMENWIVDNDPFKYISHLLSEEEVMKLKNHEMVKIAIKSYKKEFLEHGFNNPPGLVLEYGQELRIFDDAKLKFKDIVDVIQILHLKQTQTHFNNGDKK